MFWEINYVLMLNWIVWNRTDYSYKMDLALNNPQWLICHKTQTSKQTWKLNTKNYLSTSRNKIILKSEELRLLFIEFFNFLIIFPSSF